METEMKAISTCSVVGSSENQVTSPISQHPGSPEAENDHKLYPPSPFLSEPVSSHDEQVEEVESSHQSVTIPEPPTCRVCDTEGDEQGDFLVELGCRCKGALSRMHRKCFLKWYSLRMLWQNNCICEICKGTIPTGTLVVLMAAMSDHANGGRAVLMATLKSQLAGYPWLADLESAADYDALVKLLAEQKAEFFRRWEAGTAYEARVPPRPPGCTWRTALSIGIVASLVGGYAYLLYHFFGETLHHH